MIRYPRPRRTEDEAYEDYRQYRIDHPEVEQQEREFSAEQQAIIDAHVRESESEC